MRVATLVLTLVGAPVRAEDAPEQSPAPTGEPSPDGAEERPPGIWSWFNAIGFPFYGPETGLGLFAGVLMTVGMPGNEGGERPSVHRFAGSVTTKGQYMVSVAPEAWMARDRIYAALPVEYVYFPDAFFGVGNNTRHVEPEAFTEHRLYVHGEVVGTVVGRLMVGPQYTLLRHHVVEVEEGGRLDGGAVVGADGPFLVSGLGGLAIWDDRDDVIWPIRGGMYRLGTTSFHPSLGSDFGFIRVGLDARQFLRTWRDHVVALQVGGTFHLGRDEIPFQDLATLGGESLLRGWYGGRMRDRHALGAQVEYRLPLNPLFAVVAFVGAGQVAPDLDAFALGRTRVGGGGGVRLSLRKDKRVNLRLDLAYGDRPQFYLNVLEVI